MLRNSMNLNSVAFINTVETRGLVADHDSAVTVLRADCRSARLCSFEFLMEEPLAECLPPRQRHVQHLRYQQMPMLPTTAYPLSSAFPAGIKRMTSVGRIAAQRGHSQSISDGWRNASPEVQAASCGQSGRPLAA